MIRKLIYWGTLFQVIAWAGLMLMLIVLPDGNRVVGLIAGVFMCASAFILGAAFKKNHKAFVMKYEDLVEKEMMQSELLEIMKRMLWKIGQHEGSKITKEEFDDLDKLRKKYNIK